MRRVWNILFVFLLAVGFSGHLLHIRSYLPPAVDELLMIAVWIALILEFLGRIHRDRPP